VFSHAADPLEAEDWLKKVLKMLTTAQCSDREKVLYAAGRLQGSAAAWWDAYVDVQAMLSPGLNTLPTSGAITYQPDLRR
jgi:hypothetical protein